MERNKIGRNTLVLSRNNIDAKINHTVLDDGDLLLVIENL